MWRERRSLYAMTAAEVLLARADEIRTTGGVIRPALLYHECVQAFARGELAFDDVTPLYRHLMIHAGAIVPKGRERFDECPTCKVRFSEPGGA